MSRTSDLLNKPSSKRCGHPCVTCRFERREEVEQEMREMLQAKREGARLSWRDWTRLVLNPSPEEGGLGFPHGHRAVWRHLEACLGEDISY